MIVAGPPASADKPDPDLEIAKRHYRAGTAAYDASDYATALVEFEAAHRVLPKPDLAFNIARCHDRMEHVAEAIAGYRRYLATVPPPSDEASVRERVRVLEARLAAQGTPARPALTAAAPAPPPVARPRRGFIWGVVAGVAGAAALAVGLGVGLAPRYPSPSFGVLLGN